MTNMDETTTQYTIWSMDLPVTLDPKLTAKRQNAPENIGRNCRKRKRYRLPASIGSPPIYKPKKTFGRGHKVGPYDHHKWS